MIPPAGIVVSLQWNTSAIREYIRGEFSVRLEDDMHITEDGSELLTAQSNSLEKPFEGVSQT